MVILFLVIRVFSYSQSPYWSSHSPLFHPVLLFVSSSESVLLLLWLPTNPEAEEEFITQPFVISNSARSDRLKSLFLTDFKKINVTDFDKFELMILAGMQTGLTSFYKYRESSFFYLTDQTDSLI